MIKVNTEQLITAAEQMTLQVSRLQEMEDQLRGIQNGLKQAGTEFEKHISAVDRQHRKVQEEWLTLKRMIRVLESAAEQYAECERKNLTRESSGVTSGSNEISDSAEDNKFFDTIEWQKLRKELDLRRWKLTTLPWIGRVVEDLPDWSPKPVPRPHPKHDPDPGRSSRPGKDQRPGQDRRPKRDYSPELLRNTDHSLVSRTKLKNVFGTHIFDLLK